MQWGVVCVGDCHKCHSYTAVRLPAALPYTHSPSGTLGLFACAYRKTYRSSYRRLRVYASATSSRGSSSTSRSSSSWSLDAHYSPDRPASMRVSIAAATLAAPVPRPPSMRNGSCPSTCSWGHAGGMLALHGSNRSRSGVGSSSSLVSGMRHCSSSSAHLYAFAPGATAPRIYVTAFACSSSLAFTASSSSGDVGVGSGSTSAGAAAQ
jgi:hypothetical protein